MSFSDGNIHDYQLFNATDIKSFIIRQLKSSDNQIFKDVNYLGSNMNTFIDTIAVILQQLLFHLSLNASETALSTAQLLESMNKLSSLLNYKPSGKQTSILPVQLLISVQKTSTAGNGVKQVTIPRFLELSHNSKFVLKNPITVAIDENTTEILEEAAMFQGNVHQSQVYMATGDNFEKITLIDTFGGDNFVSDNFFVIFVDESLDQTADWHEYTETPLLFLNDEKARVYEKRYDEDGNYSFKFGDGTNGMKLKKGNQVVIFYLVSDGEPAIIDDASVLGVEAPTIYSSALYNEILTSTFKSDTQSPYDLTNVSNIQITPTGNSTDIVYPESVESIRNNAHKIFASQNRLLTLGDYYTHVKRLFSNYCKDIYLMTNDQYTKDFLRYYYDLGLDAPQGDSRLNIAQVNFMTSCNFNNIYLVVLPQINTVLSWRVPNYLNSSFKQEIVESVQQAKGINHNLVILDPIYRAFTWGSPYLDGTDFNEEQLKNTLVLTKAKYNKYSAQYIKQKAIDEITDYFDSLALGDPVNVSELSTRITQINGIKDFHIVDKNGNTVSDLTLYSWNPLYSTEDNELSQQTVPVAPFTYCYFYDRDNINSIITVEEE